MSLTPLDPQHNLGMAGAASATKRLLHEITALSQHFDDCTDTSQQVTWFEQVNQMFDWCEGMAEGSAMGKAAMLINIEAIWPELDVSIRERYHNDFRYYATTSARKDWVTLENHMRAVRTFFIEKVRPADPVPIPQRDQTGAIVVDSAKNPVMVYKEWDPTTVSISKLVAITSRARSGRMTKRLWSVAADPRATWEQLQIALSEPEDGNSGSNGGEGGHGEGGDFHFYVAGSYLFAREGEVEAFVGDFSLPGDDMDINFRSSDTLRARALRRMFLVLGVKLEEVEAAKALQRNGLRFYPKEAVDSNPQS